MRMLLVPASVLLLVVGGIAAAVATDPSRHRGATRTTFDATWVYPPSPGGSSSAEIVLFEFYGSPPPSLRVFRTRGRPSDELPRSIRSFVAKFGDFGLNWEVNRSRLLVAKPRIYGVPTQSGSICFVGPSAFDFFACGAVHNGVYVHVDGGGASVRGRVYGLAADGVASARMSIRGRWRPLAIRRNAFFTVLPRGVLAPSRLVFAERNGVRHVVDVVRCSSSAEDLFPLLFDPLDELPC